MKYLQEAKDNYGNLYDFEDNLDISLEIGIDDKLFNLMWNRLRRPLSRILRQYQYNL